MRRSVTTLLLLALLAGVANAETVRQPRRHVVHGDLGTVAHDLAHTPAQLLPTQGRALYLGGLGLTSLALEEHKMNLRVDVLHSDTFADSAWTDIGGRLGLSRNLELAAATAYLGGWAAGQTRLRETGLLLGESLFAAQSGAGLLNYTLSEQRPEQGGTLRHFTSGGHAASIHVTNTMALARVLDHQLAASGSGPLNTTLRVLVYAVPAVTAWERLRADQHFAWNVVLGGGQSLYMTNALLRAHDGRAGDDGAVTERRLQLFAAPAPRGAGGGLFLLWRLDRL